MLNPSSTLWAPQLVLEAASFTPTEAIAPRN